MQHDDATQNGSVTNKHNMPIVSVRVLEQPKYDAVKIQLLETAIDMNEGIDTYTQWAYNVDI